MAKKGNRKKLTAEQREAALAIMQAAIREAPDVRVLSYGGGLDSWAMLIDAIIRREFPDVCIFADVGDPERLDPAEWPSTYRHLREVVMPLCELYGIEFVWLTSDEIPVRGQYRSIFEYAQAKSMFYGRLQTVCTISGKVERIAEWCDRRYPDKLVEVWIGFEANEVERAMTDPRGPFAKVEDVPGKARRRSRWPLIERQLCRCRCEALARDFGLPVPRKSACVFCPNSTRGDLLTLLQELPDVFEKVEQYEDDSKLTRNGSKLRFSGEQDFRLRDWVQGRKPNGKQMKPYKRRAEACEICGAAQKATKATGCTYLDDGEQPLDIAV